MNALTERELGLRKAALALHALAHQDRQWLLNALPEAQRAELEPLLNELRELALPPDGDLVRQALAQAHEVVSGSPGTGTEIAPSLAAALARTLTQEAPVLQGMFLAALPEMERLAVIQHWQGPMPTEPAPGMPPALREAIVLNWRNVALRSEESL